MSNGLSISLTRTGTGNEEQVSCRCCGHVFGLTADFWKPNALVRERLLASVSPLYTSGSKALLREFICPECGLLIDAEVTRAGDPLLQEQFGPTPTLAEDHP